MLVLAMKCYTCEMLHKYLMIFMTSSVKHKGMQVQVLDLDLVSQSLHNIPCKLYLLINV